jgi:hypothetical protein
MVISLLQFLYAQKHPPIVSPTREFSTLDLFERMQSAPSMGGQGSIALIKRLPGWNLIQVPGLVSSGHQGSLEALAGDWHLKLK